MTQQTRDYLTFRRMITPAIIQGIFWILVGIVVLAGVIGIGISIVAMFTKGFLTGFGSLLLNVLWLVAMPIIIRIYCELVILFFRINETLTEIKNNTQAAATPTPVT